MKVFLAVTSLLPAYGGPAFSVSRLAMALAEAGTEVGLWAPDRSAVTTPLLPADSPVRRLIGSAADALDSFGKADVLHDNGMWLPHNHRLAQLAERLDVPRLVSTRGMLEPWAMNHKRWKKRIAWRLYQRRDLKLARYHHATAESEARSLRSMALDVPICVIPNGVDVPEVRSQSIGMQLGKLLNERKTALFLGRINPKKGLMMLVKAWARVQPGDWLLKIAGPDEAGHRAEVEAEVLAEGLGDVISFIGPVDGKTKQAALFDADLLVLPTHSENFGIVVAEGLAHGLPVLTTSGAPWSMLLDRGCGWWVEPTVDGITDGLRQATSQNAATLQAMGAKGRTWVATEFGWGAVTKQFLSVYERLLSRAGSVQ